MWARDALATEADAEGREDADEAQALVLNWFRSGRAYMSGAVEGMNCKSKLALRKAYGFRSYKAYELASYQTLRNLPEHERAHRFLKNPH